MIWQRFLPFHQPMAFYGLGNLGLACLIVGVFLPAWLNHSPQAAPSHFFAQLPVNSTYILTQGYDSYLPHFLAQSLPPKQPDPAWLISGEVDREVFVVADSVSFHLPSFRSQFLSFETLYSQDGFFFLRRKGFQPPRLSEATFHLTAIPVCR